MEKVLVTGGCGLIGQHICSGLLKKGYEVIAVDREECGYNEGKPNYSFTPCEPTDKNTIAELFENNKFYAVIHAACTVDNDMGPIVTDKEVKASAAVDKFIFRYALTSTVQKIILLSTDQVYQFPKTREPIREDNDLKPSTNYAVMKYASEKAFMTEMHHSSKEDVYGCIVRFPQVYTFNFTENLVSKITDPKDGSKFVFGQGQYGFQFCCVHNLVDFILCFVKNADNKTYSGVYNVGDKLLTSAADIISFMRENHRLGAVMQKQSSGIAKLKGLFGASKEEKQNYRYLDMSRVENNNMLDKTKASKLVTFRWDIHNTK